MKPTHSEWSKCGTSQELPSGALSRIMHLRRLMLIHCCLYYRLDVSIVSDHQWQEWADELTELQSILPCEIDFYDDYFLDWDGSTGYHLPADADILRVTHRTLKYHQQLTNQKGIKNENPRRTIRQPPVLQPEASVPRIPVRRLDRREKVQPEKPRTSRGFW